LQPTGQLLDAAANQSDDLVRTQKPVPVNEPDDFVVAVSKSDGGSFDGMPNARKLGYPVSLIEK
jgi:hypothetical protein